MSNIQTSADCYSFNLITEMKNIHLIKYAMEIIEASQLSTKHKINAYQIIQHKDIPILRFLMISDRNIQEMPDKEKANINIFPFPVDNNFLQSFIENWLNSIQNYPEPIDFDGIDEKGFRILGCNDIEDYLYEYHRYETAFYVMPAWCIYGK